MSATLHEELTAALGRCDLFRGLSESSRQMLAAVCAAVVLRKRQALFAEGQKGQSAYCLISGGMQLVKTTPSGREVVIRTVAPGELFGEVVLFEKDRYPVSAVALRRSRVCRIPRGPFLDLMGQGAFSREFVASLVRRLRYLVDRILYLTAYDVEQRFVQFLRHNYGERSQYAPPLSKKDLAAAIGATPETLSRMILRMTREKKLSWKGKALRLRPDFWDRQKERPG
jgi:CRP-like cAMP-binding protein